MKKMTKTEIRDSLIWIVAGSICVGCAARTVTGAAVGSVVGLLVAICYVFTKRIDDEAEARDKKYGRN